VEICPIDIRRHLHGRDVDHECSQSYLVAELRIIHSIAGRGESRIAQSRFFETSYERSKNFIKVGDHESLKTRTLMYAKFETVRC